MLEKQKDELVKLITTIKLLEKSTTKEKLQTFLKGKGLSFSGTWSELLEKRIIPAFNDGKISIDELYEILRYSEEYGRQHVFLYQIPEKLLAQLDIKNLKNKISQSEFSNLLDNPKIIDIPDDFTIVDLRFTANTFVAKAVTKRTTYTAIGQKVEGNRLVKEYSIEHARAVYILEINNDGLCQVRISSSTNSSDKYLELITMFLRKLHKIIPADEITRYPINLQAAKSKIWDERMTLKDTIRYSDATLYNGRSSLRAATGNAEADLLTDAQIVESVDKFSGEGVHCNSNNIFFKPLVDLETPSREVHVRMSGSLNEFVIPAAVDHNDYLYVLGKILEFNNG